MKLHHKKQVSTIADLPSGLPVERRGGFAYTINNENTRRPRMKPILLLDETLKVEVFYACEDHDLEDNICLKLTEDCAESERLLRNEESHLYLTASQARAFAEALLAAVEKSGG